MNIKKKHHKLQNQKVISFVAGGSGGHIIPALIIAEELVNLDCKIIFFTDKRGMILLNKLRINNAFIKIKFVTLLTLNRTGFIGRLQQMYAILCDIISVIKISFKEKISLCCGFGGYVSVPVVIGSFIMRIVCVIHEQNAVLGLANRINIIFSKYCMLTFRKTKNIPKIFKKRFIYTGMPIGNTFFNLRHENDDSTSHVFYKIRDSVNIFILGGSQGANIFDKVIPNAIVILKKLLNCDINITHQANEKNIKDLKNFYRKHNINANVESFFINISEIMTSSHVMISRAGASTISELLFLGIPSILIPIKNSVNNHQLLNAKYVADNGAAILIEENDLIDTKLAITLNTLITDTSALYELNINAKRISELYSNSHIIQIIDSIFHNTIISIHNKNNENSNKLQYIKHNNNIRINRIRH